MTDEERLLVVAAVAFLRDGKVLTVRKRGTDRFMLVGGKIEAGESPEQAAVREAHEEVGLVASDLRALGRFSAAAANEPGHRVDSTVFTAVLTAEPVAAAEIEELRWMRLDDEHDDLAPLLVDHVLPLLRHRRGD
ncbi:NUDIX domain-containing protein [Nocardioides aestuarii]|uniref:NUDIX domain-containing protein n=1 Tax=Nocardioides aestuarii TaxID=252231 RepID=A0ABW4TTA5_9ACTN